MLRQAWIDIKDHYTDLAEIEEPTDDELAAVADEIAALTLMALNEQDLIDRIVAETLTDAAPDDRDAEPF